MKTINTVKGMAITVNTVNAYCGTMLLGIRADDNSIPAHYITLDLKAAQELRAVLSAQIGNLKRGISKLDTPEMKTAGETVTEDGAESREENRLS